MLKAFYEALQHSGNNSFLSRVFHEEGFKSPYHFHPEYELTLIIEGEGKRYVGSNMADFTAGDLVLLGTGLPHCWKLEGSPYKKEPGAIVIQFTYDFLGESFFSKAELVKVKKLLQKSSSGMVFAKKIRARVQAQMIALADEKNNFRRLIGLLQILQQLATSKEYVLLDQQSNFAEQSHLDQERINAVLAYLVENFRTRLSLNKAAEVAGMTPNALCKYFKKITRKTFMETAIEYRLNYAAQLLVQTDMPVSSICFDSGFGDVSHFNKMFKSRMQLSPLSYRK
jgi:AraC-like DNA-binding protein